MITTAKQIVGPGLVALGFHEIHEVDVSLGHVIKITIGSWATEALSGKPEVLTDISVLVGQWTPELYSQIGEIVAAHPDWSGEGFLRPSPNHVFAWPSLEWVDPRPLAQVQASQWEAIKLARQAAIEAPIVTAFGTFDADPASQKAITDAVLLLQTLEAMGEPVTIDFTLADNTTATLTTAQMVQVGLMLGAQTQAAYSKGRTLRAAINAATTNSEVEAVTW